MYVCVSLYVHIYQLIHLLILINMHHHHLHHLAPFWGLLKPAATSARLPRLAPHSWTRSSWRCPAASVWALANAPVVFAAAPWPPGR